MPPPILPAVQPAGWDLFCRVIDNFGDVGVCWRLAADLASRGQPVRLWVDDASAHRWMAPAGHPGVAVGRFDGASQVEPGDVVVEAFGCDPPAAFVHRMASRQPSPVWINLEYLSAEQWVERSHGLPSPQLAGPGAGLTKRFFFPGFGDATGGLVCEPGLTARLRAFDADAWLASVGAARQGAAERVVTLFCYAQAPVASLIDQLGAADQRPTLLLAAAGAPSGIAAAVLGGSLRRGPLRARLLPCLTQTGFDHLLWAADLNIVRGEDSFVRAQWAGRPFVWQAYPQHDGAHAAKLAAFDALFLDGADLPDVQRFSQAWNGLADALPALPPLADGSAWRRHAERWRDRLLNRFAPPGDLTSRLLRFIRETAKIEGFAQKRHSSKSREHST